MPFASDIPTEPKTASTHPSYKGGIDTETRAHIAAITAGFVELCSILGQRHEIDKGDLSAIEEIMLHALREQESGDLHLHARGQLSTWFDRARALASDSLQLPAG